MIHIGKDIYELILSACSEKEAVQWKEHLLKKQSMDGTYPSNESGGIYQDVSKVHLPLKQFSSMNLTGQTSNLTRRSSVHGELVESNQSNECVRLFIKGTQALVNDTTAEVSRLGRSQSVHNSRQIAILAPKRQDRVRLERWLCDIWTSDILPYPGMPPVRGEHLIRSSAESLLRRLSSRRPFTKRPSSLTVIVTARGMESASPEKSKNEFVEDNHDMRRPSQGSIERDDMIEEKFLKYGSPTDATAINKAEDCNDRETQMSPSSNRLRAKGNPIRKRWSVALFKAAPPTRQWRSCWVGV